MKSRLLRRWNAKKRRAEGGEREQAFGLFFFLFFNTPFNGRRRWQRAQSASTAKTTLSTPNLFSLSLSLLLFSFFFFSNSSPNSSPISQVFTATTIKKDDAVENALKAAYKTGRVGLAATLGAGGALSATATVADVAPGLAVSLTGAVPDISSAKLGLDYLRPHLTAKATVGLSSTPKVELSATSVVKDVAFGLSGAYDSAKGSVSAWSAGASLTRPDFQASAMLLDLGKTVKLGYAHNVDAATVAGAEVTRALDGGAETVFAVREFFFFFILFFFSHQRERERALKKENSLSFSFFPQSL